MKLSAKSYEFAFWAILIVGAATALIMYQHATHTDHIVGTLRDSIGGSTRANDVTAGTGEALSPQSPATGVYTPTGRGVGNNVFPYRPAQSFQ